MECFDDRRGKRLRYVAYTETYNIFIRIFLLKFLYLSGNGGKKIISGKSLKISVK